MNEDDTGVGPMTTKVDGQVTNAPLTEELLEGGPDVSGTSLELAKELGFSDDVLRLLGMLTK